MFNPNIAPEIGNGIQSILYVRFIVDKKYAVNDIAERMGVASGTLYKWIRGENLFPAERIPSLVIATGDPKYLDYLCGETGFIAVPKPEVDVTKKPSKQIEVDAFVSLASATALFDKITATEQPSRVDIRKFADAANDAIRSIETLKQRINGRGE